MTPDTDELRTDADDPAATCPYCDRPFATKRLRSLHLGEVHADELTDAERAEVTEAQEAEGDDLWVYHLKITAAMVFLTFGFVYTYAVVLT